MHILSGVDRCVCFATGRVQEQRDAPVDVQVGFQLYEDSPQELRSRLWMALLEHPDLVGEYQVRGPVLWHGGCKLTSVVFWACCCALSSCSKIDLCGGALSG